MMIYRLVRCGVVIGREGADSIGAAPSPGSLRGGIGVVTAALARAVDFGPTPCARRGKFGFDPVPDPKSTVLGEPIALPAAPSLTLTGCTPDPVLANKFLAELNNTRASGAPETGAGGPARDCTSGQWTGISRIGGGVIG